jgi:two-component system, sensor histidine kinase
MNAPAAHSDNATISQQTEIVEQLVLAEQARTLYDGIKLAALTSLPLSSVLAGLFWRVIDHRQLLIWYAIAVAVLPALSLWLLAHFRRHQALPKDALHWLNLQQFRFLLATSIYGSAGMVLFASHSLTHQLILFSFLFAISATLMAKAAQFRPLYRVTFLPLLLPFIVRAAVDQDSTTKLLAVLAGVGLIYTTLTTKKLAVLIHESLQHRFNNEMLVEQLQSQKQLVESALAQANEANRQKSRFLAAASHDLRQPMHALGLFTSAIRPHIVGSEGHLIVDKIEASVGSTEIMFNALLDVSRLDAGILLPDKKILAVGDLLARLVGEYTTRAQAKNLRLRFRSTPALVLSDPTLLERVIRNYLSNAIRYTQRGGVLVGTRLRGQQLRIEIWDTGDGIPQAKLNEIFQEFYQLGNPERDKAKGLGLGLAIVKRIGELLSHPIEVKSQLGRGSQFSVSVPLATGNAQTPAPANEIQYDDSVLIGATILVIDDDKNVLEAAHILLKQWGCYALTAESQTQALDKLQQQDSAPDVILSDYRLRDGETGIAAIQAIQREWGPIPAALITGDTAPDRLKEATESRYELLHKPLNPTTLKTVLCRMLPATAPAPASGLPSGT